MLSTMTNVNIQPIGAKSAITTYPLRIGIRSYMSGGMLRTAQRFANLAQTIEDEHPGDWQSLHVEEHRDYVTSSVLNSALFLEAMINELFTDALEDHGAKNDGYIAPLAEKTRTLMKGWWEESGDMGKTLSKYQILLLFAEQPKLNRGESPYQAASLLLELRNRIVHYKPETAYGDVRHTLEDKLKDKFEDNALVTSPSSNWWPDRALGAGCAKWAHESAKAFTDEVSKRLIIEPNYKRIGL